MDRWTGAATVRPGMLLFGGRIGAATMHAHHSVQLLVAARGELELADAAGLRVACRAVIVPADTAHSVLRGAAEGVLAQLDPDSVTGRELARRAQPPGCAAAWARAGAALPPVTGGGHEELLAQIGALVDATPGAGPSEARHPAVARAVARLPELVADGPVRIGVLAAAAGLSESRLAHLFRAELGLPLRPYVRWLRMRRATELIAAGASLTAAAHQAGFADAAHLTRTCRRTFGIPPSEFAHRVRWSPGAVPPGLPGLSGGRPASPTRP
ncbi:helix-turn-helix transcriptional regulator [Kitasatospora sp. NBC_00240]|uniref:helix-turn-helix transcriptional regulator n=1 Tax=Kitasatospora sp. NBC_00240 TaxID=2903567 RepID=UPI00225C08E4|nr:helix-turn-helix transcriptional regulator [Kitasatospora sp. NBC_00240]MCX5210401.1 helix-turn-helix transcriptional regulator [Kitasatospora sp. NBC_00240]